MLASLAALYVRGALDGEMEPLPQIDPAHMRVNVRTRVIWGMKDGALVPGNLDGLQDFVPDLDIVRVPDATHWIVAEKPELVNQLIREF